MRYLMKAGTLSTPEDGTRYAQITSTFWSAKKTISLTSGGGQYQTDIIASNAPAEPYPDVCGRMYTMTDGGDGVVMEGRPGYARDDDPEVVGWPVCRAPKVDHADVSVDGTAFHLIMHNSQNYSLEDENGASVVQIMHNGISGGWTMDSTEAFSPQILCGLFVFCRYIEQENEFFVV